MSALGALAVESVPPRIHGGPDDGELARLGLRRDQIFDLSASTNPYGPSPSMLRRLREVDVSQYPDSSARGARQVLGKSLGVAPERLVLGNGAAELLWTLRVALPNIAKGVVIVEPTFCEFRAACVAGAIPVVEWRAREENRFQLDLLEIQRVASQNGAEVVYLCSPNTPTGQSLPAGQIGAWAEDNRSLTLVLDQSFLSLSDRFADAREVMPDNVVCVRSLTKDHGIPGVRVGYAVATPELVTAMDEQRPAWTVSSVAQAAVIASVFEAEFLRTSRRQLSQSRKQLVTSLQRLGLHPLESSAPFVLVRVPNAAALRLDLLARHRVLVRDCSSFGLPDHLRLSVRSPAALKALTDGLEQELKAITQ